MTRTGALRPPYPGVRGRLEAGFCDQATRRLLTLTRDAMPDDVPKDVIVQPAYEWLLMERD